MRNILYWAVGGARWLVRQFKAVVRWLVRLTPEVMGALLLAFLLPLLYFWFQGIAEAAQKIWADPGAFFSSRGVPISALAWGWCLVATGLLAWPILRRWGLIWAVARKMIIEAIHRKVIVVLLIFFIVLMPSLPFILKTEGNVKSQVQIVITYALALGQVLLSLVAVFLCTASVCGEIDRGHIHVLDPKPLARWQYLVGKLLGVTILCSTIMFLMGGAVYGLARYVVRDRDFAHLSPLEWGRARNSIVQAREEVLVTRRRVEHSVPDFDEDVDRDIRELRERGELGARVTRELREREIRSRLRNKHMSVKGMSGNMWKFDGLKPDPTLPIFLRFKPVRFEPQAPKKVTGYWEVYHDVPLAEAEPGGEKQKPKLIYRHDRRTYVCGAFQEIALPGAVRLQDGDEVLPLAGHSGVLYVGFFNARPDPVFFEPDGGLELMQRTEGFLPNYYRSLVIVLCQITLLAAISIMAGAALSLPVASLLVGAVFIAGLLAPWVVAPYREPGVVTQVLKALCYCVPHFARFNPIGDLVNGQAVGWGFVGRAMAALVFGWGAVSMFLATLFYSKRELARVIL